MQGLNTPGVVGWRKLRSSLAPLHPYFQDKQASVAGVDVVEGGGEEGRTFAFPRVSGSKKNPFVLHERNRKLAGRTLRMLEAFRKAAGLRVLPVLNLEWSLPKSLSLALGCMEDQYGARELAWALFKRYWAEVLEPRLLGGAPGHLPARANLHLWASSEPVAGNWHFHFHIMVLLVAWEGFAAGPEFHLLKWGEGANGGKLPVTEAVLADMKAEGRALILRTAKRHGWRVPEFEGEGKEEVLSYLWVDFQKLRDVDDRERGEPAGVGRAKLLHDIAYMSRSPLEDFAAYTLKHPGAAVPDEDVMGYSNKSRLFGYWKNLREVTEAMKTEGSKGVEEHSPVTGEVLEGKTRTYSVAGLLEAFPSLGGVDFESGGVVETLLSTEDRAWLLEHSWEPGAWERACSFRGKTLVA
ncbi:MAG: hypothetical protein HY532_03560 [Chloroflexi bacterium]|nr:hypothetical protein [Chloroflexota bacterium]